MGVFTYGDRKQAIARGALPGAIFHRVCGSGKNLTPGYYTDRVVFWYNWYNATPTLVEQTSGAGRSVKSTSAADDLGSTGCEKMYIEYVTTSGEIKTEVISLDGTTYVDTNATDIYWVRRFEPAQVGSGGMPAGTITLYGSTGGTGDIIARIEGGSNHQDRRPWEPALWYVGAGRVGLVERIVVALPPDTSRLNNEWIVPFSVQYTVDHTDDGGELVTKTLFGAADQESVNRGEALYFMNLELSSYGKYYWDFRFDPPLVVQSAASAPGRIAVVSSGGEFVTGGPLFCMMHGYEDVAV